VEALMVFAGAALGAPVRYLLNTVVAARFPSRFPWGTFVVNVAGSFVLGLLTAASSTWMPLLGTGFCGGLTTYSTFSYETVRLLERGDHRLAVLNVLFGAGVGVGAAYLGYVVW
jgi:fluoride exporter